MSRIPQPMPSLENPGHYEDVFDTTNYTENGCMRPIDEFAPRANLKKLFKNKMISSKEHNKLQEFSQHYIVEQDAVLDYVRHMEELKATSSIKAAEREKEKAQTKMQSFEDYHWSELISNNGITKLTVPKLKLYIEKYGLSKVGKKADTIERIKAHYYLHVHRGTNMSELNQTSVRSTLSDYSSSDDDDEVLRVLDTDTCSSSEEEIDLIPTYTETRSGRQAGSFVSLCRN